MIAYTLKREREKERGESKREEKNVNTPLS
jgi:hypothetical protein